MHSRVIAKIRTIMDTPFPPSVTSYIGDKLRCDRICMIVYTYTRSRKDFVSYQSTLESGQILTVSVWVLGKKSPRPRQRPVVLSWHRTTHVFLKILENRKPPETGQKVAWSALLEMRIIR